MEKRFKSSKYGAVFLRMGLVNLHRLQKEIQEGKREELVVHPKCVETDSEEHRIGNNPLEQFWMRCFTRAQFENPLTINEVWTKFTEWKANILPREKGISQHDTRYDISHEQVKNFLVSKMGPEIKKSVGVHRGKRGYWGVDGVFYRQLTSDEHYAISMGTESDAAAGPSTPPPLAARVVAGPCARRSFAARDDAGPSTPLSPVSLMDADECRPSAGKRRRLKSLITMMIIRGT